MGFLKILVSGNNEIRRRLDRRQFQKRTVFLVPNGDVGRFGLHEMGNPFKRGQQAIGSDVGP